MNIVNSVRGFGYYIIDAVKKSASYINIKRKEELKKTSAASSQDSAPVSRAYEENNPAPEKSESLELAELVRNRTVLLGIYSKYPSAETKKQITALNGRIYKISPDFPLSEPTMHIPSVIGQKYAKAMYWIAKNSGIILLALTVASVGGVIGITAYSGNRINKYRREIAIFNKELTGTKKAAEGYRDLVNSWKTDITSLGENVDEALAKLDDAKEFFVMHTESITDPLSKKVSGLEKRIEESNEKFIELECLIGEGNENSITMIAELDAKLLAAASSQYAQYNALYAEISNLNKESLEYRVQLRTEIEERLNALKAEINTGVQAQLDELKGSLKQLEEGKLSAEEFNRKMNESKNELDKIKNTLNSLKSEIQSK